MFHYLHIRMLRRRGRVSRPVILSSSIHNPAYPSRLGDACLACFAIRHIPPVSATPANACAFANPSRLGGAGRISNKKSGAEYPRPIYFFMTLI